MNNERIVELLQRVALRDQRIYELEQELKVKDAIIRKQVIMLSEMKKDETHSVIPENVDTSGFWQAQEGDCCYGNHVTRDEDIYCNRCGRELLWELVK